MTDKTPSQKAETWEEWYEERAHQMYSSIKDRTYSDGMMIAFQDGSKSTLEAYQRSLRKLVLDEIAAFEKDMRNAKNNSDMAAYLSKIRGHEKFLQLIDTVTPSE